MLTYVIAAIIAAAVFGTVALIMAIIGLKKHNDKISMPAAIIGGIGVFLAVLSLCMGFFST